MALMNFYKAYGMLLHSWILETLDMSEIVEYVCALIKNNILGWKIRLSCNNQKKGLPRRLLLISVICYSFDPTFCSPT